MKKKLLKMSLICFIIAIVVLIFDYICFHYITDSGFTATKQEEAQKPFITNLIGMFGIFFFFTSVICFISSFLFFNNKNKN